ncbi:MAG: hypothetical protein ACQESC_00235 [Nanobdellota archaeon]
MVSNKTMGVLLIAAIVISIGGAFTSLILVNSSTPTGHLTNEGQVDLNIQSSLAINLTDNAINFGDCTPDAGSTIFVDSDQAQGSVDNSNCSATGTFPDRMALKNVGNVNAIVNLTTTEGGDSLFGTAGNNGFAFKAIDGSSACTGTLQSDYQNMTASTEYSVCSNMNYADGSNQLDISAAAWLSPQATGGGQATWTFNAYTA